MTGTTSEVIATTVVLCCARGAKKMKSRSAFNGRYSSANSRLSELRPIKSSAKTAACPIDFGLSILFGKRILRPKSIAHIAL